MGTLDFDFNFSGDDRAAMIAEAERLISAEDSELSGSGQTLSITSEAASSLLTQLNEAVAEFGCD